MEQDSSPPPSDSSLPVAAGRLDSWKEIAAYLKRDVSTVQRWEKNAGLPVHRIGNNKHATIFAIRSELDAWLANGRLPENGRSLSFSKRAVVPAVVFLAIFTAVALYVSWDAHLFSGPPGLVVRKIFEGPDAYILSGPSPDGRYFGFIYPTMDVGIRDMRTLETQRITTVGKGFFVERRETPSGMVFSPDGKEVAYIWTGLGQPELRVSGVDGSGPRTLVSDAGIRAMKIREWCRNGKVILVSMRQGNEGLVALVDSVSGKVQILRRLRDTSSEHFSISPDGRYVIYDWTGPGEKKSDIYYVSADGSQDGILIQHPANDVQAVWTWDGRYVLFFSDRSGTMDIWLQKVEGASAIGEPVLVKRNAGTVSVMGFTADNTFYYGNQFTRADAKVASFDLSGTNPVSSSPINPERLGTTASPRFSPDGSKVAYIAQSGTSDSGTRNFSVNKMAIVVRDFATGEEKEVAPAGGRFGGPAWLPDGSLLMAAWDTNKEAVVNRINPRTGKSEVFARTGDDFWVQEIDVSRDGRKLYYRKPLVLSEFDARSRKTKKLFSPVYAHAISPDGGTLAIGHWQTLRLLPLGGEAKELWTFATPNQIQTVAWMPDGKTILIGRSTTVPHISKTELWIVPVDGSPPRPHGLTVNGRMRNLSVSPDGKRIVYTDELISYEIWALENFVPRQSLIQRILDR